MDVQIKRVNYTEQVRASVYERMISERKRIAERSRSEGQGRSAEIRGQRERERNEIESEAYKQAEDIRGVADGRAAAIYAGAYSRDPDFYQFLKTLETYRSSLGEDVTLGAEQRFRVPELSQELTLMVAGESQTIYPWDSWRIRYEGLPRIWFHDIFRADGTPFGAEEVQYIRSVVRP